MVVAADSLATFPNRGRPGRVEGTRELVTLSPYLLIYEAASDTVRILSVWHAARNR